MKLLLKNATCIIPVPASCTVLDLRIEGDRIVERGRSLRRAPDERVMDMQGKIIMPGFVCAHTHLYSSLARGMAQPPKPPRTFPEILDRIWWRLDRALDEESIYYSALAGAVDAIRCGTTTVVDHHASPNAIDGSLGIIRTALRKVGIRAVLCYEVTDRAGMKGRDAGLRENERFIRESRNDRLIRGMVGAHASFTLSDESLRHCGNLAASLGTGVHIHVAEDLSDTIDSAERYRTGVIARLGRHGILKQDSILAHCVHLPAGDFRRLGRAGCWLVHNPRSNMNNGVGHAPIGIFGKRAALGTDGFPADMLEEARIGFFAGRHARDSNHTADMLDLLGGGQKLISRIFGSEFGTLRVGSAADLIILDYIPPTPINAANLTGHMLFGMRSSMIESVMIGGKWVMSRRRILGVNADELMQEAQRVASRLWKRMKRLT